KPPLLFFWRKPQEKKVDSYRRLVLMVKMRKHKRIPPDVDTNAVFMKMFKDIPKLDLEMILPGTRMQMPGITRFKLGGSLIGTLGFGVYKVFTQLWEGIQAVFVAASHVTLGAAQAAGSILWGPFLLLGGYAYKQYAGYQVTKQTYSKMLTESLYYQNLDNNLGVVTQVMDEAEEQECRETMLA